MPDDVKLGNSKQAKGIIELSRRILHYANRGDPRISFLREISTMLLDFSGCDGLELRLSEGKLHYHWTTSIHPVTDSNFIILNGQNNPDFRSTTQGNKPLLDVLCHDVAKNRFDPALPCFTDHGSFWSGNVTLPLQWSPMSARLSSSNDLSMKDGFLSLAIIPFLVADENVGLMLLKSKQKNFFTKQEIIFYEGVAQTLGLAVSDRNAQAALRERVKELTCLYGIARIAEKDDLSLSGKLQRIVELLPPSWQHPDIAAASISLHEELFQSSPYSEAPYRQSADIVVNNIPRGEVEVVYLKYKPDLEEGAFLDEEESLIEEVARRVAEIVEKVETQEHKSKLQEQLRHADRLATIGQLAAGVAHELNEPLGSILGFAQLAKKGMNKPDQAMGDLDKIEKNALHAREIVRKLLLFARQVPTRKTMVNLNKTITEAVSFFESRCERSRIEIELELDENLPKIEADPAQMNQVIINLVVNAIYAMPTGGKLSVSSSFDDSIIKLVVDDNGCGMNEDVRSRLFIPFFTTKDIHHGTGLGLSVVHGIVISHNGVIKVESQIGCGAKFTICLPHKQNKTL